MGDGEQKWERNGRRGIEMGEKEDIVEKWQKIRQKGETKVEEKAGRRNECEWSQKRERLKVNVDQKDIKNMGIKSEENVKNTKRK